MGYAFILAAIVTNHTFKETDQLSCKNFIFSLTRPALGLMTTMKRDIILEGKVLFMELLDKLSKDSVAKYLKKSVLLLKMSLLPRFSRTRKFGH